MLVFQYPQRLDTIVTGLNSVKLVCVAAPCQPHQGRFATKGINLHIYPSPVRISTERGSKTNRAEVVHQNFISHYRCHLIYVAFPLLPVPALSLLGADHLIAFGVDQPARISPKRTGRFLCFLQRGQS